MHTFVSKRRAEVRASVLMSLGVEFTRSHGLEYAKGLLEVLGADDEIVRQLIQRVVAERCALRR